MSDEPLLEVEDLRKSFGGITAVDGLDFALDSGTITGLIGPNGAGKTTTFNLISGFYKPDGGVIRYRGTDVQQLMGPSEGEKFTWGGASGLTFGATAAAAGANAGFRPLLAGAVGLAGAGAGVGVYLGQEAVKKRHEGYRHSRPFQLARAGIVRTFQITRELSELTVLENLLIAPPNQSGERLVNAWFRRDRVSEEEDRLREQAEEVLELLDLSHLRDEQAGNLSGGQRKLLELGRVLMLTPDLILLDEPVAGVNPALTDSILRTIESLRDEGYSFCVVEHDIQVIMELSERVIVMSEGKKLTDGPPEQVKQDEAVIEAYLGE
jgi:branched-chain amino acid transport system ATP-binding protein